MAHVPKKLDLDPRGQFRAGQENEGVANPSPGFQNLPLKIGQLRGLDWIHFLFWVLSLSWLKRKGVWRLCPARAGGRGPGSANRFLCCLAVFLRVFGIDPTWLSKNRVQREHLMAFTWGNTWSQRERSDGYLDGLGQITKWLVTLVNGDLQPLLWWVTHLGKASH